LENLEEGKLEYESVGEFLAAIKEGVQRRGGGVSKDSRVEKIRARRKDNGEVHSRV